MEPSASILQLNGDACASPDGYVSCAAQGRFLELSECVNTCPDSILPVKTSEGVYECLTDGGEYGPNVTNLEGDNNLLSSSAAPTGNPTSSATLAKNHGGNVILIMIIMTVLGAHFARK